MLILKGFEAVDNYNLHKKGTKRWLYSGFWGVLNRITNFIELFSVDNSVDKLVIKGWNVGLVDNF